MISMSACTLVIPIATSVGVASRSEQSSLRRADVCDSLARIDDFCRKFGTPARVGQACATPSAEPVCATMCVRGVLARSVRGASSLRRSEPSAAHGDAPSRLRSAPCRRRDERRSLDAPRPRTRSPSRTASNKGLEKIVFNLWSSRASPAPRAPCRVAIFPWIPSTRAHSQRAGRRTAQVLHKLTDGTGRSTGAARARRRWNTWRNAPCSASSARTTAARCVNLACRRERSQTWPAHALAAMVRSRMSSPESAECLSTRPNTRAPSAVVARFT